MNISKRDFFISLAVLSVVLIAANETLVLLTRNSLPRRYLTRTRESADSTVVAVGNSLVEQGMRKAAFDRAMGLRGEEGVLNLGLGPSSPVEHLLFLRYAMHHLTHPRLAIYGFFQTQLTAPVTLSTRDLIGNASMLYYVEPDYARAFYNLSWHDQLEFAVNRHIPMVVERGAIWGKVERLRRSISQEGLPAEPTNRFGRVRDFVILQEGDVSDFARQCEFHSRQNLSAPVEEMLKTVSAAGARFIIVEMPLHPDHLRLFYDTPGWERYRQHLSSMVAARGAVYIDASHWLPDARWFQDRVHLTDEGANRFSESLGKLLMESRR